MPEQQTPPSSEPKKAGRFAWTTFLVVVILGFAAFTIKTFIDDHNRNNTTAENTNRDKIAEQFAPPSDQQPTPAPPINEVRGPENTPSSPKVLGSETNTPAFKPYRNEAFGFSATIPAEAQVAVSGDKITVNGPAGIFWTLTKYDNTQETLSTIETQLKGSPSVTSVARTSLGDIPALIFTSPNLDSGTGYAFIIKDRLYYLVGNFTNPESWQGFTFF